jgi:hypothetical protein
MHSLRQSDAGVTFSFLVHLQEQRPPIAGVVSGRVARIELARQLADGQFGQRGIFENSMVEKGIQHAQKE